jgi:hypothetical protein
MYVPFKQMSACIAVLAALTGCTLIDEDTSDCVSHYRVEYRLQLGLETRPSDEVNKVLKGSSDVAAATALLDYMGNIFSDVAHDLDLSFYDVVADSVRLHQEQHLVEADRATYAINIAAHRYMHLATANLRDNAVAVLRMDDRCRRSRFVLERTDTVASQRTGLFTTRLPMELLADQDQEFSTVLYMANSGIALVADTLDSHIRDLDVFASGFADGFNICDSTFRYGSNPVVRTDRLDLSSPGEMCFAAITFPSPDVPLTRAGEAACWEFRTVATLPDGSRTQTILAMPDPLPAGGIKVLKVKVLDDGSVTPADTKVGVSVTLDWSTGYSGEIPL